MITKSSMKVYICGTVIFSLLIGCATPPAPPTQMSQCSELCKSGRVDSFKDDVIDCRCNFLKLRK